MTSRIIILGAGFAALTTIRELRRRQVDALIDVVRPARPPGLSAQNDLDSRWPANATICVAIKIPLLPAW
jgi:hypothetical protein